MAERRKEDAKEQLKATKKLAVTVNAEAAMNERVRRAAEGMERVKKSVEAA